MRAGLLVLSLALLLAACGGNGGGDDGDAAGTTTTTTSTASGCESVDAPAPRDAPSLTAPKGTLDPGKTWSLTFETSCGDFTVELDPSLAPEATNSLVFLAREGYFDDTVFHRIVPGFVIQGGDPTQTGAGGPGYATLDVPPGAARYTKGTVAMAKSGLEPAGTAGSQFFVVTAEGVNLPAEYAIVGKVSRGMDVVERIGELGDAEEKPTQPVVVRTVTVSES
ncbi:MAG TPA: peptidylprolyl isomerase [Gaiellaceae bacterium]|jgi:peptidyl-prolyl cis-trans isomerase B (cyclophilin B)|nr:peptidylprolyl isomerase [Gaiellaceae bacterium]